MVRAPETLRRNVQVFPAVPGEPKNIILTRATELAPPEGIAGRQERDARESAVGALLQVRDSWRGHGTNWGNLLGGAAWQTSNMADFVATKKAKRDFSLPLPAAGLGMTNVRLVLKTYGPVSRIN